MSRSVPAHIVCILVLLLAGSTMACDRLPATADPNAVTVSVDSSGTVPVITVSGEAPQWSLDSPVVIRAEPEVGFSRVRSLALDPSGGVWVADVGEKRLSHWDDQGGFVEDRGREGSGPGEFRTPYSIAVHDRGLFVHDPGNSRVLRFALDGGQDSSWLTQSRITGDAMTVRLYPDPAGPRVFDLLQDSARHRAFTSLTGREQIVLRTPPEPLGDSKVCRLGDGISDFGSPFSPRAVYGPSGGELVMTVNGDYRLDRYDSEGTLRSSLVRPVERERVGDAEYEAGMADWREYLTKGSDADCEGDLVRYEFKPAVSGLFPDPDGRLWVERRMPGRTVYEVWDGDSLLGWVPAPDRESDIPPAMLGGRIAVVTLSPDGGHEVRLYRVNRPQ